MYFVRFYFFALIFEIAEVEDPDRRFKPDVYSESNLNGKKYILERMNKGPSEENDKLDYYGDYSDSTSSEEYESDEANDDNFSPHTRSSSTKSLEKGLLYKNKEFPNVFSGNSEKFNDRKNESNNEQSLKKETTIPHNKENSKKKKEQFDKGEESDLNSEDVETSEGTRENEKNYSKVNVSPLKTKPKGSIKWKPKAIRKQIYEDRKNNLDEKTAEQINSNSQKNPIPNVSMQEANINKKKQEKDISSSIKSSNESNNEQALKKETTTPHNKENSEKKNIQSDKEKELNLDSEDVEKFEGTHENEKNNTIVNASSQKTKPKGSIKRKPGSIRKQIYKDEKKKFTEKKTTEQNNLNTQKNQILNGPMQETTSNIKIQEKDISNSIKSSNESNNEQALKNKENSKQKQEQFDKGGEPDLNSKDVEKSEGTHENEKENSIMNVSSQKTKPKGSIKWKPDAIRKQINSNPQKIKISNAPKQQVSLNKKKQEKDFIKSSSPPISNIKKNHKTFNNKAKNSREVFEENSNENKKGEKKRKTKDGNARKKSSEEETSYADEDSEEISVNAKSQQSTKYDLISDYNEIDDIEKKSEEFELYRDGIIASKENLQDSDEDSKSFEPNKESNNQESSINKESNSKIPPTCDNSWSYIDEPIPFSEDDYMEGLQSKASKKKGNLFRKPCGTLSSCVNNSNIAMSPWFPLLLKKGPVEGTYSSIRCGVTLISRHHVIGASKCVLSANTDPLYLLFGSFNFADEDHDGLLRKVETIALVGEELELAVLIFEELILFTHVKPICINEFDESKEELEIMKTVAWKWSSESVDTSDEVKFDYYCGKNKRVDKRSASLTMAKKCPQLDNSSLSFCMRTKTTSVWYDEDTVPGLPLMISRRNKWFLRGIVLKELQPTKRNSGKKVNKFIFEDIEQYLPDLNVIIRQTV